MNSRYFCYPQTPNPALILAKGHLSRLQRVTTIGSTPSRGLGQPSTMP